MSGSESPRITSLEPGQVARLLSDDPFPNHTVETAFHSWAQAVGLAQKLRTMRMSRSQDGEAFNTAAYKGRTLYKIRVSCAYYRKNTVCDYRLTYQTDAGTVPDDSWAWTIASPFVNVPGTGYSILTLGTPLTLDDTLWLTSWISDYTPPTSALQDNFFRIDSPVRMYFQD